MLVLSRREGEAIVVPDCRLEIVVKEIMGDKVRIGINAPQQTDIYRHEIWQQICFDEFTRTKDEETDQ